MSCDTPLRNRLPVLLLKFVLLLPFGLMAGCEDSQQQPTETVADVAGQEHNLSTQEVREVLETFVDASVRRDYSTYYDLLSAKDHNAVSRQDFLAAKQAEGASLADAFYEKVSHRIGDVVIDKDRAHALVEYRFPDVEYMIKHVFGLSILSDFTQKEIMQMKTELAQAYQDKPVPMKSRNQNFELVREEAGWRVYLRWDETGGPTGKPADTSS